jgi:hypothetical protein
MLEQKWQSAEVERIFMNLDKKGSVESRDFQEIFLLFTIKRKLKLMSHMINNDDINFEFKKNNFVDVLENDVFDMGVLLYREYFLEIMERKDKKDDETRWYICTLLVNSFEKANGQLDSKVYLFKRFI